MTKTSRRRALASRTSQQQPLERVFTDRHDNALANLVIGPRI